jgi:hypothetical protein
VIPTAKTAAGQKWRDFQEWSLGWMNKAERATVVAAHRAIAELNPEWTGDQVGERVEKMIRRTQNAISSIDMSEFLRQTKSQPLMGLAFMFTNQASKTRDTLRLAALKYQRSGKTPADRGRLAASAALMFASAAIVPAVVRSLWGQVRQGGREQEADQVKSAGDYLSGAVADLADIAHPIIGDVWRVIADPQHAAGDSVNSRALAQVAQGVQGAIKSGRDFADGNAKLLPTLYRTISNLARGAATFTGVPLDAPLTAAEGIGRAAVGRPEEFHLQQEAAGLRRLQASASDEQLARLQQLDRIKDRVAHIRRLQVAGEMTGDEAAAVIRELLDAAGQ